jgi:hypothetical protein
MKKVSGYKQVEKAKVGAPARVGKVEENGKSPPSPPLLPPPGGVFPPFLKIHFSSLIARSSQCNLHHSIN